jgi:hypothetical protein
VDAEDRTGPDATPNEIRRFVAAAQLADSGR